MLRHSAVRNPVKLSSGGILIAFSPVSGRCLRLVRLCECVILGSRCVSASAVNPAFNRYGHVSDAITVCQDHVSSKDRSNPFRCAVRRTSPGWRGVVCGANSIIRSMSTVMAAVLECWRLSEFTLRVMRDCLRVWNLVDGHHPWSENGERVARFPEAAIRDLRGRSCRARCNNPQHG